MTSSRPFAEDWPAEVFAEAAARSEAIARRFRASAGARRLAAWFVTVDQNDAEALAARAEALFADDDWVGALIAPLTAALAADPWFEPPLRVHRDALRTGAILLDTSAASITATILSADALAAAPPAATIVIPGRLTVVRYARSGGAWLRRWQAEPATENFRAAAALPCVPLDVVSLGDGDVVRIDGRTQGHQLEGARGDIVTLTASIRVGAAAFAREYAAEGGALVRTSTSRRRAPRCCSPSCARAPSRCGAVRGSDARCGVLPALVGDAGMAGGRCDGRAAAAARNGLWRPA